MTSALPKLRVVVVDDEPMARVALRELLSADGEVEIVVQANLDSLESPPFFKLKINEVRFSVPRVGAPETPVLFDLYEVSSDRVSTLLTSFEFSSAGNYLSFLLGSIVYDAATGSVQALTRRLRSSISFQVTPLRS